MGLLHIWDDSDWTIRWTAASRGGTRDTCPVPGTADGLYKALDGLRKMGKRFDSILFETHGEPGMIRFGVYGYRASWFRSVKTRGYTNITTPYARIYFNGCNVAADPGGWDFLDAVAEVFLTPGGGEVFGQTSTGFANPISGHVVHLWGSTRRIYVRSDGRILERFEQ